jgi:uncharacterized membrane protein
MSVANGDTVTFAEDLTDPIVQALDQAVSLARGHNRALIRTARADALELQEFLRHPGHGDARTFLDLTSTRTRNLAFSCQGVLNIVHFERVFAAPEQPEVRTAPAVGCLLAAAGRLLPPADRARYAGEFQSEVWELAHAGVSRRVQLVYAARQLMRAWNLRAELRAPRRRQAAP